MPRLSVLLVLFFLAAPAHPVSAATSGVPKLDVSPSCEGPQTYGGHSKDLAYERCMQDEKEAHDRLVEKWAHFNLRDRRDCLGQGIAPAPSYVEILTCLEMAEDARAIENPGDIPARTRGGTPSAASSAPIPSEALTPGLAASAICDEPALRTHSDCHHAQN